MFNIDCYLGALTQSDNVLTGNIESTITYSKTPIICEHQSISNKEFYQSQATGLKPELTLKISTYDYKNEMYVKYDDEEYTVLKTLLIKDNPLEMLLTLVKGIINADT